MRKIFYIIPLLFILGPAPVSAGNYIDSRIEVFEFQTSKSYALEEDALNEAFSIEASIASRDTSSVYKFILDKCQIIKKIQKPIIVKLRKDDTEKSIGRVLVKVRCL